MNSFSILRNWSFVFCRKTYSSALSNSPFLTTHRYCFVRPSWFCHSKWMPASFVNAITLIQFFFYIIFCINIYFLQDPFFPGNSLSNRMVDVISCLSMTWEICLSGLVFLVMLALINSSSFVIEKCAQKPLSYSSHRNAPHWAALGLI